jgi:hypothetical protein
MSKLTFRAALNDRQARKEDLLDIALALGLELPSGLTVPIIRATLRGWLEELKAKGVLPEPYFLNVRQEPVFDAE